MFIRFHLGNMIAASQTFLKKAPHGKKRIQLLILAGLTVLLCLSIREGWLPRTPQAYHTKFKDYSSLKDYKLMKPLRPERFEAKGTIQLPHGKASQIPKIQYRFPVEKPIARAERQRRASAVKAAFLHAYGGYKEYAWAKDELAPITGSFKTPFCGWAATLVDSLDTMLIMGLHEEFEEALKEVSNIDFTGTEDCMINLFETTIRHLGGLLSAYDISGEKHKILLTKAVELGEILYTAFDTPNRMPSPHYLWSA
jgi:mannosyl-oligosaccharide alpha-1,2-mannosidase